MLTNDTYQRKFEYVIERHLSSENPVAYNQCQLFGIMCGHSAIPVTLKQKIESEVIT